LGAGLFFAFHTKNVQLATLKTNISKSLEIFIELFGKYLSTDDCMEFYSHRKKNGTETFLRSVIYSADRLSTVILEE